LSESINGKGNSKRELSLRRSVRKEAIMKVLSCKDIGVNCAFQARGRTVDEVLKKASEHAKRDHDIKEVTKDYLDSWRPKVHDERIS